MKCSTGVRRKNWFSSNIRNMHWLVFENVLGLPCNVSRDQIKQTTRTSLINNDLERNSKPSGDFLTRAKPRIYRRPIDKNAREHDGKKKTLLMQFLPQKQASRILKRNFEIYTYVSHIVIFTRLPDTEIAFETKSTPIVDCRGSKVSLVKRKSNDDFPTPELPTRRILKASSKSLIATGCKPMTTESGKGLASNK